MPLLSIIIPVYNVERYLKECLDSIINQTFKDIEIICINDGSTDGSLSILTEYAEKDNRITIINQKNSGQAVARNIGLQASQGKYISFIDSDDWIERNTFEVCLHFFKKNIDLLVFDMNIFNNLNTKNDNSLKKNIKLKFSGNILINHDVILNTTVSPCNKIYRKDIVDKHKISFPCGLLYEDNSFHWKYMIHSKYAYFLKEKFYHYRIREDSTMHQTKAKSAKVTDHLLICLEIFEYLKKCNLLTQYQKTFVKFFEHCLGIVCMNTDNLSASLEIAHDVWSRINIPTNNSIILALKNSNYDYLIKWINYSFLEKIFSIKKRYAKKIITILGIQIIRLSHGMRS